MKSLFCSISELSREKVYVIYRPDGRATVVLVAINYPVEIVHKLRRNANLTLQPVLDRCGFDRKARRISSYIPARSRAHLKSGKLGSSPSANL